MTRIPRLRALAATSLTVALITVSASTTLAARPGLSIGTIPQYLTYVTGSSTDSIWLAAADGSSPRKLGPGEEPLVSPYGSFVAAAQDVSSGSALKLYATQGKSAHAFFNVKQSEAVPVAWSPDERYLAVDLIGTTVRSEQGSGLAVIDTQTLTSKVIASGQIFGASFAPGSSDQLVYASAPSRSETSLVNLHTVNADGTDATRISSDGLSLNPIWGAKGIFFDRERLRGNNSAPAYQVWLRNGAKLTQVTHMSVPSLLDGLVPTAVSADGNHLLASYVGEDTDQAWTLQLNTRKVRQVKIPKQYVEGTGISMNGNSLLIEIGAFENSPNHGTVERIPFGGGQAVKLVKGAEGSWNL